MSDLDPLRNLAQTLAYDPGQPVTMTKGVVQSYDIAGQPPTLKLYLSGDNTTLIEGVRFLDSYSPAIGDVVQVIKQGPMLLVLGQIAGGAAAGHEANGWVEPTLSSGFATHAFDKAYYRLVLDNGSKKIQLRGRLNITGTPSLMWTMPVGLRPQFDLGGYLAIARDPNGATTAHLNVKSDGTINLISTAVGVGSVGSTVSSVDPADGTTTTDTNHKHKARDFGGAGDIVYADQWTDFVVTGGNGVSHSHGVTGSHFHNVTVGAPSFPTFISLNGVEYFI